MDYIFEFEEQSSILQEEMENNGASDPITGLNPITLAAASNRMDVWSIFHMIQRRPELISRRKVEKRRMNMRMIDSFATKEGVSE